MKGHGAAQESYTVLCSCGARPEVRASAFGRPQTCGVCGVAFRVEWSARRTPVLVFLKTAPAKPAAKASEPAAYRCPCGTPLKIRAEHTGKDLKCPTCKKSLRFEKVRDPQTMTTTIRRIEKKPDSAKPGAPAGAQPLLCACGEQLSVRLEHVGRQAQCPACGALMKLEKSRDPQTMETVVRARIVGKAPPPDLDAWSLDDFK